MPRLTFDVYTNYAYLTDYAHIEAQLYDNETKQNLLFLKTSANASTSASTPLRIGEFPGLSERTYTLIVRLLDTRFRIVHGRMVLVAMRADRVTRVGVNR